MKYYRVIKLKDGRKCVVRNGEENDAPSVLDNFITTHGQTDYLTSHPEEIKLTEEKEKEYLKKKADSEREVELVAEVDGVIVGTAGIDLVGPYEKTRHRASFGISIEKSWWGIGIGRALTDACVECAIEDGYCQLELEVVADNVRAIGLYKSVGFIEYGRNPKGFRSRINGWQEIVLMRLDLEQK